MPPCPAISSVSEAVPNAYIVSTLGEDYAVDAAMVEKLWAHVERSDGCWLWTGTLNTVGYGSANFRAYGTLAHRFSWMVANGPIPKGMCICHHCDVKRCVRPDHLFLGTHSDNQTDRVRKGRHNEALKTHCKHGHEFTPENTYHNPAKRPHHRSCRQCIKERSAEYTEQHRQQTEEARAVNPFYVMHRLYGERTVYEVWCDKRPFIAQRDGLVLQRDEVYALAREWNA